MRSWSMFVVGVTVGLLAGAGIAMPIVRAQAANPLAGPLAHVALVVNNAEETAKAFGDVFGVKVPPKGTMNRGVKYAPVYQGAVMNGKFMTVEVNGIRFEIIEPLDGPSVWKDYLLAHGEGVQHIGLSVDNSEAARKVLEAKGGRWTLDYGVQASYVDMAPRIPMTFELLSLHQK